MTDSVRAPFRRLHAIVLIPVLLAAVACATQKTVRLASDTWPPYTGHRPGAQVSQEIVSEALERAGYTSRTSITKWTNVLPGIEKAQFDGSAAVWRSAEREKLMLFSRAYLENRLVLVGRKGADVSARSLADLDGKRVGVVTGYAYGSAVADGGGPKLVEGASDQESLRRLLRNEVDLVLVDELLIRYVAKRQEAKAKKYLEIGTVPLIRRPLHFAVRKDLPGAKEMVAAFDKTVNQMMADGSYNRILRMNWIRADVDGDGQMEYVPARSTAGKVPPEEAFDVAANAAGSKEMKEESGRFYIDGKVYESWSQVPEKYRRDGTDRNPAEPIEVTFFDFDF